MQWHGHSSYCAHTMQHFIVSFIYIFKSTILIFLFIEIMKVQVVLYSFLLFPGQDETWFYCYTLLNRDCLS